MSADWLTISDDDRRHVLATLRSSADHWRSAARLAGGRDPSRIESRCRAFDAARLVLEAVGAERLTAAGVVRAIESGER